MNSSRGGGHAKRLVASFPERCRESGLKVTVQRLAVYEELAGDPGHPSAEQVHARLRRRFPTLSLATVYRTLVAFEERGLASKANPIHAAARFDANRERHHHVACRRCQSVEDFYSAALDRLAPPPGLARRFRALRGEVVFIGLCASCEAPGSRPGRARKGARRRS